MKRLLLFAGLLLLGIAIGAAGGYGVGVPVGEDRAFDKTAQYLHQGGTPPWAGQGNEGLALCITLTEGEDAGARCLTEVDEEQAEEEAPSPANNNSGSPTPQTSPTALPTVDLHITILSPAVPTQVAATPTIASSATPSPTATARPTRDTGD